MKIELKNKQILNCREVVTTNEFLENSDRSVLTIDFDPSVVSFEELINITKNTDNLSYITIIEDSDTNEGLTPSTILEDFEIKVFIKLHSENDQDKLILKLAKMTTIEKQLKALVI